MMCEGSVSLLDDIPDALEVHTAAASEYDWELVSAFAELAEKQFLQQV